jgi:hypothetical protein
MVEPDGAFGAGDLVAQVHAAAEGPAHLKLADGAALKLDESNGVILGLDGMHQCVGPTHDFDGTVVLAHVVADDLDAVATKIDDGAAARLLGIPKPGAVGTGVCLARARPRHLADLAGLHRLDRLDRLWGVDQIFEITGKDARLLHRLQDAPRFLAVARQRFGQQHGFAGVRGQLHRFFV